MQHNKLPWLDWMRFIAACIVMLGHIDTSLSNSQHSLLYSLFINGNLAVLIFFVLSGFLVGGVNLARIKDDSFNEASYAIDRIARIAPPLIGALIFTIAISYYIENPIHIGQLLTNRAALVVNGVTVPRFPQNGALWSLNYEIWFYILIFAISLIKRGKYLGLILLTLIACLFNFLSPVYLFCWLIGAAAFFKGPQKISYTILTVSILLMAYGSLCQIKAGGVFLSIDYSRIIFSYGAALFIRNVIALKPKNIIVIRVDKLGISLASFSYSLYLTHYPTIKVFEYWHLNFKYLYYIEVIACFTIAALMYFLFERNTHKVRKFMKIKYEAFKDVVKLINRKRNNARD